MGDLSLQRLSPATWPQPLRVSPAGQAWKSQHTRTRYELADPRPSPSPSVLPPSPPAALDPLIVLRLQHRPLTLSFSKMATQHTPSLLPGQIHSLSNLSTSLFYLPLSASSLSNDSLIYLALCGQPSRRQAGPGFVPPSWEGGGAPRCQAPTFVVPIFQQRKESQTPSSPCLFSQDSGGIPKGWGSHAPSAIQYFKASSSGSPREGARDCADT